MDFHFGFCCFSVGWIKKELILKFVCLFNKLYFCVLQIFWYIKVNGFEVLDFFRYFS